LHKGGPTSSGVMGEAERRNVLVEKMEEALWMRQLEDEEDAKLLAALEDARLKLLRLLKVLATHIGTNMVGPRVGTALFLMLFPGWPLYK